MAICYFAAVSNFTYSFDFKDQSGETLTSGGNSTASDEFVFAANETSFVDIKMGGTSYVWGKDGSTQLTKSSTTPYGMFRAMFMSSNEQSVTKFTVSSSMYFLTSCFKYWDGYSIDNDPEFRAYSTAIKPTASWKEGEEEFLPFDFLPIIIAGIAGVAGVVVVVIVIRKRRRAAEQALASPVSP